MKYPSLNDYMKDLKAGKVPEFPPEGTNHYGTVGSEQEAIDLTIARVECQKMGMWGIVDLKWTSTLVSALVDAKITRVLEVYAGAGYLTQAIKEIFDRRFQDMSIIATDSYDAVAKTATNVVSDTKHTKMRDTPEIRPLDALTAVSVYGDMDALLVSWPPGGDNSIIAACNQWGENKPIIYIGEDNGGNTAPAAFFEHYSYGLLEPANSLMRNWPGMHGVVCYGYWRREPGKKTEEGKSDRPILSWGLYDRLPDGCKHPLRRYIEEGLEPGSFIKAILKNDLKGAMLAGDRETCSLYEIWDWLWKIAPAACFGSPEAYKRWIEIGPDAWKYGIELGMKRLTKEARARAAEKVQSNGEKAKSEEEK